MLGAGSDDDVVGIARHSLFAHQSNERLAERELTLAAAVLQRRRSRFAKHVAHDGIDLGGRQRLHVRHPAGKRDDLRPGSNREQRAHFRGGHPGGPARVAVDETVDRELSHGKWASLASAQVATLIRPHRPE